MYLICFIVLFASTDVSAKHFFMVLHYDNGKITAIEDSLNIKSGDIATDTKARAAANNREYMCELLDKGGQVLNSTYVTPPIGQYVADWVDDEGNLQGIALDTNETDFMVRIPYSEKASSVRISSKMEGDAIESFEELSISVDGFSDISALESEPAGGCPYKDRDPEQAKKILLNPPKRTIKSSAETRAPSDLDIVILGHGFEANPDIGCAGCHRFNQAAEAVKNHVESEPPYNEFPGKINWYWRWDAADYVQNQNCTLGVGGCSRCIRCDGSYKFTHASNVHSGWDEILILYNSTEYGGSANSLTCGGGDPNTYAMCTSHNDHTNELAIHELGHSIGGLNDEYVTGATICPNGNCCADSNCANCGCPCGSGGDECRDWCSTSDSSKCARSCLMSQLYKDHCLKCLQAYRSVLNRDWW